MSAGILRALMQLFAIISGSGKESGKKIVAVFLRQQLNNELVNQYLQLYEEYAAKFHKGKNTEKRTSMASVKVLRICDRINEELQQKEKYFVLVRLLEFIYDYTETAEQEWDFVETVADAFNIDQQVFVKIKNLIGFCEDDTIEDRNFLIAKGQRIPVLDKNGARYQCVDNLKGTLIFLRLEEEGIFFMRYLGQEELYLNSQNIMPKRTYVFGQGANIRGGKINPVFYSDILHRFISHAGGNKMVYRAENVSYYFPGTKQQALHQFNINEESGNLVGIMGGSGAGKSTFLNVLNGNYAPTYGKITCNGIDIYAERDKISGILGYVAQDDLLIEELSVFQNLYYNAKLCLAGKTEQELEEIVIQTLKSTGLYECKDLRVGSVLDKTISGGQRKRLNIALELIREPSILFVDEPTSGLSSRDSENIMDLLKELTLRGKLIFVVIHQPSSDIFKMLDKLFILDTGGYPIYYGNPIASINHFKRIANHVNYKESECPSCGSVNPEQIFNIIEAKVVDEYGNETEYRKVSPKEWNNFYNVMIGNHLSAKDKQLSLPESAFNLPKAIQQFKVFVTRDVLSKWSNTQYMLINMLEAPVLAFVLSLFIKFYPTAHSGEHIYTFRESLNFPQYLFISVVVAIFLGLTVSAEEIIKDQKILKRERYLHLNKGSYLIAKIGIMFVISFIQSILFVAIGNYILEVKGMFLPFWAVLFSTSCFANVLGLNISATFNSAKVIYIIIPILIIPQLLFSGIIVRFDRLYPAISSQSRVPFIGNVMVSRWAYEAMAVHQFKNNDFQKEFFEVDKDRKFYSWKKDYWSKELKAKNADSKKLLLSKEPGKQLEYNLTILRNELQKEVNRLPDLKVEEIEKLTPGLVNAAVLDGVDATLGMLEKYYVKLYNNANQERENKIAALTSTPKLREAYLKKQDDYFNESLEDFATNKNDLKKIVEYKGELVQKQNPVFLIPTGGFLDAQFYAPSKMLFGWQLTTLSANLMVIWLMTLALISVLFFDGFKKLLDLINRYFNLILKVLSPRKEKEMI